MTEQSSKSVAIKDFFKRNVLINELEDVLRFKPDTLIGVDKISSDHLNNEGVKSIEDLANLSVPNLPEIKEILPNMLIKWVKIAQVIQKNIKEQLKRHKKLLLIGLDNGGKTSILAVLQDKFSIIKSLLPTRGVKREKLDFFGYPIISWDLGGQVQYREKLYFNRPELFFTEADIMLYVVDSQDPDRIPEAVNYFREVLKVLEDLHEIPSVLIVLSKSDQDARKTLQWQQNVTSIKNKFNSIADEFDEISIDYCDTTVVIILNTTDEKDCKKLVGIIVDAVAEVYDIARDSIRESPNLGGNIDTKFIKGIVEIENKMVILTEVQTLLNTDELIMNN